MRATVTAPVNVKLSLKKGRLSSFVLSLALLVFSFVPLGCASKKPALNPLPGDRTMVPSRETSPVDSLVTPPSFSSVPLTDAPKQDAPNAPRLALVLGGAGVASFATVGLLKRFHEEGIKFDFIEATGWPALFALGNGLLRSTHDLEWFAMRLQEKDIKSLAGFDRDDEVDRERIAPIFHTFFSNKTLDEVSTPLVISAKNTDLGKPETFDSGEWQLPLMKTMSIGGLFRGYPSTEEREFQALDIDDALNRGAKIVVAIEMYDDYLSGSKKTSKQAAGSSSRHEEGKSTRHEDELPKKLYETRIYDDLIRQMPKASIAGKVIMKEPPLSFSSRRRAIYLGYREATKISKQLRVLMRKQSNH